MARLTGTSWNGCYPYLDYSYSQSVSGNYTDISWAFGYHFGNYYFRTDARQVHWSATTGSGTQDFGPTGTGPWPEGGTNTEVQYATGTFRLFHDTGGNGTTSISFSVYKDYSGALTQSYSGSLSFPVIPRTPSAPGTPSVSGHNDSNPTTATISWTAPADVGSGLSQRQVQVSTSSAFTTTIIDSSAVWGTSYSATGLPKGTTLYTRVRASSSVGWGPWSSTTTFTTGTTVPGAPGTPWTGTITYTSIQALWNAPSDDGGTSITGYVVERATNSGFTTGLASYNVTGTSYTITGLTEGTAYWIRVKAVNATGTSAASTALSTGTTAATAPSAPGTPTFSAVTGTTLTASWTAASDNGSAITSYTLEYSLSSIFTTFTTISGIAGLTTQVTGLGFGDTYYFRVKAVNAKGTSAASATGTQTMGSTVPFAPAAPTIGNITQISATVSYTAPTEDGGSPITGYDIQRATNSTFTQNVVTTPDTASPLAITGLLPAIPLYVRVRAKNINGNGAWSPTASFTPLASAFTRSGSTWIGCQIYTWNGSAQVLSIVVLDGPPATSGASLAIGVSMTAAGSVASGGQLASGLRAGPGLVGFLGSPATLTVLNSGDSFVGTVLDGTSSSWDTGNLIVRGDNLVIDGYQINAPVYHGSGTNLTIRNSIIHAPAGVGFFGIGASGGLLTVEDTTVICEPGPGTTTYAAGILGDQRSIVRRCDVSGSGDGIHVCGIPGTTHSDGSIVSQNYIHGLSYLDSSQHLDGIQVYNTTAANTTTDTFVLIEHNYVADNIFGPVGEAINAAMTLGKPPADNTGPFLTPKVDNNYFPAGAYHFRLGYRVQNAVVTNNALGLINSGAGEFGFVAVDLAGSVASWSENRDGSNALVNNPNP